MPYEFSEKRGEAGWAAKPRAAGTSSPWGKEAAAECESDGVSSTVARTGIGGRGAVLPRLVEAVVAAV